MPKAPLTTAQITARIKAADKYLQEKFPDLAYCLLVAQQGEPGTQNIHSTFNMTGPTMRKMLQGFATHHALNESKAAGNA